MSAPGYPMPANSYDLARSAAYDPTAVAGRRVVAGIVDLLLWFVLALFISPTPLSPLAEYADNDQDLSMDRACEILSDTEDAQNCLVVGDKVYWTDGDDAPIQAGVSLAFWLLYIGLQGLTGFTPGKLLLGLRTVDEHGSTPGILKSFGRTVLFIVDGLPCFFALGFICMFSTTGHRRVGDMVAKTFVVGKNDAGRPVVVPGMATAATGGIAAPLTGGVPTQYGTPTVYPAAPPYQPTAPAPGTWGAPPQAPVPGPTDSPAWGTPPVSPGPPAPGAPAAPGAPGAGDTQQYDVPFGAGAGPTGAPPVPPAIPPTPPTGDATAVYGTVPAPPAPPSGDDTAVAPRDPSSDDATEAVSPVEGSPAEGGPTGGSGGDPAPVITAGTEPTSGDAVPPADAPGAGDEPGAGSLLAAPDAAATTDAPAGNEDDTDPDGSTLEPSTEAPEAPADTAPEVDGAGDAEAPEAETTPEPAADDTAPEAESEAAAAPAAETGAEAEQPAAAAQQGDSPYQPQWDAARGAYIQWDPNRSRWLQWDDTAKEWKPI